MQQYLGAFSGLRPEKKSTRRSLTSNPYDLILLDAFVNLISSPITRSFFIAQYTGSAMRVANRAQVKLWVDPIESVEASHFLNPFGTEPSIILLKEITSSCLLVFILV